MQTILLNIIHPSGEYHAPVQVPLDFTVAQLLQHLTEQAYIAPGAYHLVARGTVLLSSQSIGRCQLHQSEAVRIIHEPIRPHFEGGRGKGRVLQNTMNQYAAEQQQPAPPPPKPAKKGLLAWLFS
ncbi:MAG: hypothetical protein IPN76_22305 [Saprospiraceae bacterium]|nr:hypothetical protein [Saprospiraceae bacterium]